MYFPNASRYRQGDFQKTASSQSNQNWTNDVLFSKKKNISVDDLFRDLFVDEWSTQTDYLKYFKKCAASSCTYIQADRKNFAYALSLFIGLYGGLVIIYRLIIPFLVKIILKYRHRSTNRHIQRESQESILRRLMHLAKHLNLYKNINERTEINIKEQKIASYVYLILLTAPTFHQVCSSDFIDKKWFDELQSNKHPYVPIDWRNTAYTLFQLLSTLCRLGDDTIKNAIQQFMLQSFVTSNILSETELNKQLNMSVNQLSQSMKINYGRLINTVRLVMQIDQPYMARQTNSSELQDASLVPNIGTNESNHNQPLTLIFRLNKKHDGNSTLFNCICGTDPNCQSFARIYNFDRKSNEKSNYTAYYKLPGWIEGCSTMDSLLLSDLQCLYSSDCLLRLEDTLKYSHAISKELSTIWFSPHPLVYNSATTQFLPNTSIGTILQEIMIEKLNPSFSYENFYKTCAPTYCSYMKRDPTKTILASMMTIVSLIGGLTFALRLISLYIVKLIFYLWKLVVKRRTVEQEEQDMIRLSCTIRLRNVIWKVMTTLRNAVINFNLFHLRDFNRNLNRATATKLGQWASRLYILLFITGNIIFIITIVAQPQTITKRFDNPSLDKYNQLVKKYGDQLECPCSAIASPYGSFAKIEPTYHQVCSSPFVSDQWRMNITADFLPDLFTHAKNDYRLFLLAHLQFLQGLCKSSIESVNNTIEQFNSSVLVTAQLLSREVFDSRMNSIIEQHQLNAPTTFVRILSLIRIINHGNAIVSKYGSNFQYIVPSDNFNFTYVPTEPMIYDNECSCGLYSNCTTQAYLYSNNATKPIPIKGLKMGCTPSESFRYSTLECFYDQSCIRQLEEYTKSRSSIIALSPPSNRSSINRTIDELINTLFVEKWSPHIHYPSYFQQCLPSLCLYTYIKRFDILHILTLLLGFQGGLSIVLAWICPKIIRLIVQIQKYQKKRNNIIEHTSTIELSSSENNQSSSSPAMSEVNFVRNFRCSFKIIIICFILILAILILVWFSIYFAADSPVTHDTSERSVNTTKQTVIETVTTTKVPPCQLTFEQNPINSSSCNTMQYLLVADFNSDSRLDLCFYCKSTSAFHVLIGDDDLEFKKEIVSQFKEDIGNIYAMTAEDFNNDSQPDLVCTDAYKNQVIIFLSNENATLTRFQVMSLVNDDCTPYHIALTDFNNDGYLDIATGGGDSCIALFLGNGTGNFSSYKMIYTTKGTYPSSIGAADFNKDGYSDIVVGLTHINTIYVYLTRGDGTFDEPRSFTTGHDSIRGLIHVIDLNNDSRLDIVFSDHINTNTISIWFGDDNVTFNTTETFTRETYKSAYAASVKDFNCDGHLDIAIGQRFPHSVGALLGFGDGSFYIQETVFAAIPTSIHGDLHVAVGDLNNDGNEDVIMANDYTGSIGVLLNTCQCCLKSAKKVGVQLH
ncbi:unnamed protein product [Adineta steineri]|uniref:Uncharacterized protein n=1 Tax=Adineta steineri TaxID=433720 RepID=A0A819D0C3_9BILA|nr:unnamed protein product [Adineta steineri]